MDLDDESSFFSGVKLCLGRILLAVERSCYCVIIVKCRFLLLLNSHQIHRNPVGGELVFLIFLINKLQT